MPIALSVLAAALLAGVSQVQPPSAPPIPPDEAGVSAALRDSPRHGEWIDVAMPGGGAAIRTWVVHPERPDTAPVVIVIHEIFGLTDWVRGVADQLAAEGFIALAPDLLCGMGPGGGGTSSFQGDAVREAIRALKNDEVARRLDAVRAAGIGMPSAAPKSACIGFCWGGSSSFAYAAAQPGLSAAIVYYGTAPTERDVLRRIACPVMGLYGGDDSRVTSTVEATTVAMKELKKHFEPLIYPGAGHGFLRQPSGRDGANGKAAREAWAQTVSFLKKNLEPAALVP